MREILSSLIPVARPSWCHLCHEAVVACAESGDEKNRAIAFRVHRRQRIEAAPATHVKVTQCSAAISACARPSPQASGFVATAKGMSNQCQPAEVLLRRASASGAVIEVHIDINVRSRAHSTLTSHSRKYGLL